MRMKQGDGATQKLPGDVDELCGCLGCWQQHPEEPRGIPIPAPQGSQRHRRRKESSGGFHPSSIPEGNTPFSPLNPSTETPQRKDDGPSWHRSAGSRSVLALLAAGSEQAGGRQGAGRGQAEPISEAALARSHP